VYIITTNKTLSMKNINIIPINSKGQRHGYCIVHVSKTYMFRGTYKNNLPIGYIEYHRQQKTTYHII